MEEEQLVNTDDLVSLTYPRGKNLFVVFHYRVSRSTRRQCSSLVLVVLTYEKTSMIIHIGHQLFLGIDPTNRLEVPSRSADYVSASKNESVTHGSDSRLSRLAT